jgi:hypothetical protein
VVAANYISDKCSRWRLCLFWLFPLIFYLPQTVDFTTFIIFVNVLFAGKRLLESECHLARRRILPCFGMGAQAFQHHVYCLKLVSI